VKPSLDVAYRFYDNAECGLTNEQRRSALEHVVLRMLQVAADSAVVEFFADHITVIMASIETLRTASVRFSALKLVFYCFQSTDSPGWTNEEGQKELLLGI